MAWTSLWWPVKDKKNERALTMFCAHKYSSEIISNEIASAISDRHSANPKIACFNELLLQNNCMLYNSDGRLKKTCFIWFCCILPV